MAIDNPVLRYREGLQLPPLPRSELQRALRSLAHAGDADDPLAFVGRERELDTMIGTVEPLLHGEIGRRRTLLIQGAPGSGKTALVREVARRLEEMGVATLIEFDVPRGGAVDAVYLTLADRIAGTSPDDHRVVRTRSGAFSGGLPGVARGEVVEGRTIPPKPVRAAADIHALASGKGWGPAPAAVVFIDEIQNIATRGANSPEAGLVSNFHTQDKIPVLLILSGLSDSKVALDQAGVSRVTAVELGRLPLEDARACLLRSVGMAVRAGVECRDDAAVRAWAEAAGKASDGWPRHIQNYLLPLWQALNRQERPCLDGLNFEDLRGLGDRQRENYYAERIDVTGLTARALRPLHQAFASGRALGDGQVVSLIQEGIAGLTQPEQRLIDDRCPPGEMRFRRLLHAGVVTRGLDGNCVSPIPSMVDHVLRRSEENTPREPAGGDSP